MTTNGALKRNWPDRDEWARITRTAYGDDIDDVREDVSRQLDDYATADQAATAVAELRAYWLKLDPDVRAANAAANAVFPQRGNWRDDPAGYVDALDALPAAERRVVDHAASLRDLRKDINKLIRNLTDGFLPRWSTSVPLDASPAFAGIAGRHAAARDAAEAAFVEHRLTAPIDDAAWQRELGRRAQVEQYLAQPLTRGGAL